MFIVVILYSAVYIRNSLLLLFSLSSKGVEGSDLKPPVGMKALVSMMKGNKILTPKMTN